MVSLPIGDVTAVCDDASGTAFGALTRRTWLVASFGFGPRLFHAARSAAETLNIFAIEDSVSSRLTV